MNRKALPTKQQRIAYAALSSFQSPAAPIYDGAVQKEDSGVIREPVKGSGTILEVNPLEPQDPGRHNKSYESLLPRAARTDQSPPFLSSEARA